MQTIKADSNSVKILGRTVFSGGTLFLIHSASSISFYTDSPQVTFVFKGDETTLGRSQGDEIPLNAARYEIRTDGMPVMQGFVNCPLHSRTVETGSCGQKKVLVQLIKLSEAHQSYMGIESIQIQDGCSICAAGEKKLKIEFIGDSITCGYGLESRDEGDVFCTATENAARTYAYLAAEALDADCSFVSYSSFGVVSGWTESGELNDFSLLPKFYEKVCFNWNHHQFEGQPWDFSLFTPDIIVVNLGTNDISYCRLPWQNEEYVQSYVAFLKRIRTLNPKAFIVCALGIMIMGDPLSEYMEKAVSLYSEQTGDCRVKALHFVPQTKAEGYGAGYHPSAATQKRCAVELEEFIRNNVQGR